MEGAEKKEGAKKESLVERKRQEAFAEVCDLLDERMEGKHKENFDVHGRTFELTSAEDCMVAFAQDMRERIEELHHEIIARNDYRQEQASAKLLALVSMYERLIALYAELRSYYPRAATRIEAHLPSLNEIADHGQRLWDQIESREH